MAPQEMPPGPPGPALFPASLAQGLSLMLSQGQMGAQALVNQQAQTVQTFSKFIQQSQVNFLNSVNSIILGPMAQVARPPMMPAQLFMQGGEGMSPSGFFPEQQPQAVHQRTQAQVPYYPLTEGQIDYTKGGMTRAPQQEVQFQPEPRQQPNLPAKKTEFF